MTIADFILPKWRHSNPEIRIQAVNEFGPSDAETLIKMAKTDADAGVRIAALGKITDTAALIEIGKEAGEKPVSDAIENRLNRLYYEAYGKSPEPETRRTLVAKIKDESMLSEVACEDDDPDIRMLALDRISSSALLCRITENNCGLKVGLAVVEQLTDENLLRRIAANASNKKVRKQAEEKIAPPAEVFETGADGTAAPAAPDPDAESTRPAPAEQGPSPEKADAEDRLSRAEIQAQLEVFEKKQQRQAELERICQEAETCTSDAAEDLKARWNQIDASILPELIHQGLQERFDAAMAAMENARISAEEKEEKAEELRQERLENLQKICKKAESLLETEIIHDENDLQAAIETLKSEWECTYRVTPETEPLKSKFDQAISAGAACIAEAERERERRFEEQKEHLYTLCRQVEDAQQAGNRTGLEQEVRTIQAQWREAGELVPDLKAELEERFKNGCDEFFKIQRDFWEKREWEWWANLNQKEELITIAEALAEEVRTDGVAPVIRELHNRWKETGPVARDKSEAVWNRFRSACDKVYGRCLEDKKVLHERVLALTEPVRAEGEPEIDAASWENAAEELKVIQKAWNDIGPLPRSLEKEMQNEFQRACNAFFETRRSFYQQLDSDRQKNLTEKTRLCEEAEILAASTEWQKTANRLKELQRRWKGVGPVPKTESERLWKRFRSACDTFFAEMEKEKPANLERKISLCQTVEELARDGENREFPEMKDRANRIMEIQKEWKTIGPVPEDQADALWQRFRAPCDAFFERYKSHMNGLREEQKENRGKKEALTRQAEALADSTDWKGAGDQLKNLQKEWQEIGSAGQKNERELWGRFRGACDAFFTRRNRHFNQMDRQRQENLAKKEDICLRLEVLVRLMVPEKEAEPEGGAAAEQLSIGLEYKDSVLVPGDRKTSFENAFRKVRNLQEEWKETGPGPSKEEKVLWERYKKAGDLFFQARRAEAEARSGNKRPEAPAS